MKKTCSWFPGVVLMLSLALAQCPAIAQEHVQQNAVDCKFTFEANRIRIIYSLRAPVDRTYDVQIVMRSTDDSAYAFTPKSLTGQFGRITYLGGTLEVWWDYKQDGPVRPAGGFYFQISANEIIEGGGLKWWHYAAAGVGIVAGVLAFSNGSSGGGLPPVEVTLPDPPRIQP